MVENETHFILSCPLYSDLRLESNSIFDVLQGSDIEKCKQFLYMYLSDVVHCKREGRDGNEDKNLV